MLLFEQRYVHSITFTGIYIGILLVPVSMFNDFV